MGICQISWTYSVSATPQIKHKKCIIALLETNFETMSKLMNELKTEDNTDGEDVESENEN